MKKIVLFTLFAAASGFALACNGDNSNDAGTDSGPVDSSGNDVAKPDTGADSGCTTGGCPPVLKTQIDRMGRPAINTALNHTFDPACTTATCAAKDSYNADKNVQTWPATYGAEFRANAAILDSLDLISDAGPPADAGGCGNGLLSYASLAALVADDQLYVDTSKTTCAQYLAVELQATSIVPNTDCGGRKMTYDVMNFTYAVAAGNVLAPVVPVTDGPTTLAGNKTPTATFPYLPPPI